MNAFVQWIRDNALKIIGGLLALISAGIVYINSQSPSIAKILLRMEFLQRQHAADIEAVKGEIEGAVDYSNWLDKKKGKR